MFIMMFIMFIMFNCIVYDIHYVDNVSLQKYGQFIIYSLSCSPIEFAIASLPCYNVSFEGLDCQLGSSSLKIYKRFLA